MLKFLTVFRDYPTVPTQGRLSRYPDRRREGKGRRSPKDVRNRRPGKEVGFPIVNTVVV